MLTRWGRDLDPDRPLPEYPRPQLAREQWTNLNGRWDYAITPTSEQPATWDGEIVVPFSPEAPLSGVRRQLKPDEWLWYRRRIDPPAAAPGGRVLLHFGAVDQTCTVFLDGNEVGAHTGGYLPFTVDVTAARPGSVLEVRVRDLSETSLHARGKQRLDRGGIWYTAQSGIWQTVWLESVPRAYVDSLLVVPHLQEGIFEVTVVSASSAEATVVVRAGQNEVGRASAFANQATSIALSEVHPWSPEDPFLYDVDVVLGTGDDADVVSSYAALRSFGVGNDADGHPRLLLNGEPYQHVGVLDQGYWPDGLMTAPSDAALVHDIETMKACGFNTLRKHVKVEALRWYAHCDRIGMLVWQDMVNGGGRYRSVVMHRGPRRSRLQKPWLPDRLHEPFGRSDAAGRHQFLEELRETIRLLHNVVSIAVWVPFNEGWGQFDANAVACEVTRLDPTRQVNHASGWIDQGGGDIRALHCYGIPFRVPLRGPGWLRRRRVLALDEYGGYTLRVRGHLWRPKRSFGYRAYKTPEALLAGFEALHRDEIAPAVARGLAATVYTQLSDVEVEINGLMTWDREVLKIPADRIRAALEGTAGR
jgi:hypothetical protein